MTVGSHFCNPLYSRPRVSGQGGLIAVAITMVIAMVLASSVLTGISSQNAVRAVSTKQSLQTYYVAQAGIQEALASRMVPRTNYLNFVAAQTPYLSQSGLIYQDPINRQKLLGQYRYIILGGDAARDSNGNYYAANSVTPDAIPRLLATASIPDSSPFIIISNASVCKSATSKTTVAVDRLISGSQPSCRTGYVLDELTVVAQARLARESPIGSPLLDRADKMRVYKDSSRIPLPAGAMVPGYSTWQSANSLINFNTAWNNGGVRLDKVVFYNFADNTIYADVPINGAATTTVVPQIPTKAVMRLYFNTPIDYRSLSPTYDRQLADCKGASVGSCNVRVMQATAADGSGGTAYSGNTMIPLMPGSTQLILLPPLSGQISGATRHTIKVDGSKIRSFNGIAGTTNYSIIFTTP